MLPAHVPSGTLTLDAAHVVAMTGSAEPVDGLSVDVVASVDTVTHTPTGTLVLPTPKDRFEVGDDGTLSLAVAATTSDEWNVSGWHYRVRLRRPGLSDLTVRVQVSPGETVSLGEQFALKPVPGAAVQVIEQGKGDPGDDGHSPVVSMVGDQVAVDGVIVGPHLTGKPGGMGSLSIGSVTSGDTAAAVIRGEAPAQVLDLTIPKGSDGKPGPANTLSIGSVTSGATAGASITGTAPSQTLNLTLPQGSPGPKGDSAVTASTVEIRGTGSPYGVVMPPAPGTYYTDTAGTNGAWRWIAAGTDRYSWQVAHGDTQWRGASLPADVFTPGSYFQLRRQNGLLVVRCGLEILPSANVPQIARSIFPNLSDEWLPMTGQHENVYGFLAHRDNGPDGKQYGKVGVWGKSWGADVMTRVGEYRLFYEGTFSPRSARWPATLPGNQYAG